MVNLFSLEGTTQESYDVSRGRFKKKIIMIIINSNKKVKEAINNCNEKYGKASNDLNNSANSDKKSNLKKDTEEQVKDDKKVKTLKFNTWGEWLDYLDKELYKTFE